MTHDEIISWLAQYQYNVKADLSTKVGERNISIFEIEEEVQTMDRFDPVETLQELVAKDGGNVSIMSREDINTGLVTSIITVQR
jgi:hypothetical protein